MSELIEREVAGRRRHALAGDPARVYCGIMADHDHPNEKDQDQARQLIAAIGQSIGTGAATSS